MTVVLSVGSKRIQDRASSRKHERTKTRNFIEQGVLRAIGPDVLFLARVRTGKDCIDRRQVDIIPIRQEPLGCAPAARYGKVRSKMILSREGRRARAGGHARALSPNRHPSYGRVMNESEQGLVKKAQTGDRAAFEELVRRTSRLLFARLYLGTGDRHWAEDLLQETWLLAYRSLGRLNDPDSLRPWLLAIAQNVLGQAVRRQTRQKRLPPPRAGAEALEEVPCSNPSPDQDAERAEAHDQILAAMRSLPEEYRLPLTLRYMLGADYETIETQLGLTNGSLRGLLHRGLKILRARLRGLDEEDNSEPHKS
jgi:RNA polymerase sigma-70 factor (ECF subfamily)